VKAKDSIAKVLLWAYIRVKGLELLMGGLGHGVYICRLEPWEPPRGPWEGVCSPRVCPDYHRCIETVTHWIQAQNLEEDREEEGSDS